MHFLNVNQNVPQSNLTLQNQMGLEPPRDPHTPYIDESVPWRKIRSRSLQPPLRGRDRPSERGRGRSLSIHRLIQSRSREPVRPWIEETIKLKPAVITRKVIERGGEKLEAVLKSVKLKPSQIERRKLIREELEKVELKSVQREYLNAVLSQIADNEDIEKDDFKAYIYAELQKVKKFEENIQNVEQLKNTEDTSILQLTKQVDELVMRDALRSVPRKFLPYGQGKTTAHLQQLSHQEDSNYLTIGQQIETSHQQRETEGLAVTNMNQMEQAQMVYPPETPVDWRRPRQHIQNIQNLQDSSILQVNQQAMVDDRIADWRKPRQQELQHIEDSTLMHVSRSEEENQNLLGTETPHYWRQPKTDAPHQNVKRTQDIATMNLSQNEETEQHSLGPEKPVSWRKPHQQNQQLQHTVDSSIMDVTQLKYEEHHQIVQEQPVHWRTPKSNKQTQNLQYIEDISHLNIPQTEETDAPRTLIKEEPVNWRKPRGQVQNVEDQSILGVSETRDIQDANIQSIIQDEPVNWRTARPQPLSLTNAQLDNNSHDDILVSKSSLNITSKIKDVERVQQLADEAVEGLDFVKNVQMKVSSQITKTERRTLQYDDSQPLPELELITQKRLVEDKQNMGQQALPTSQPVDLGDGSPKFIQKLTPQSCEIGSTTKLFCSFDGEPKPTLSWFFNNSQLFASENIRLHVYENCGELEIMRVEPSVCGVYTCVASNEKGRAICRSVVNIGKLLFVYIVRYAYSALFAFCVPR